MTGDVSGGGNSISGSLHGDWAGDVITLNGSDPLSSVRIKLADPAPIPLPNGVVTTNGCLVYTCTTRVNYHDSAPIISFDTWVFDLLGSFDTANGTGNLTGLPKGEGKIGTVSLATSPTFTVTAAQDYGTVNQALANAEASTIQAALNAGNVTVLVYGTGVWNSIDLPDISAILNDSGSLLELDFGIANAVLRGYFEYELDVTFANSIVDFVGGAFFSLFSNNIANLVTSNLVSVFNGFGDSHEYGDFDCMASRAGSRAIALECIINANFLLAGDLPPRDPNDPTLVSAPAMAGLFGLSALGLAVLRRRQTALS